MHSFPPQYESIELIASSNESELFRAVVQDRNVALKVPLAATVEDLRRFQLERRTLNSLDHPTVVPILDIGETSDGTPFYCMPFCDGGALRECTEDYRSPKASTSLILKLLSALIYLHEQGFLHRDIKPENVLFHKGEPLISDFGLAKELNAAEAITVDSVPGGTPHYQSPEQLISLRRTTEKSDTYSLGVLWYELLTGRRPPADDGDWRPSRFNRSVRGQLDQIILGCLQESPERRYSPQEMENAIKRWQSGFFPPGPRLPRNDYPRFVKGSVDLDVVLLFGGDGKHRYEYPDGIECETNSTWLDLPDFVLDATEDWLRWKEADCEKKGAPFENRRQPRVADLGHRLSEGAEEYLHPALLRIEYTDYFTTQCTNFAADLFLKDRSTIRDFCGAEHNDWANSKLANPLATNFSVVTTGDDEMYIFTTQRGKLVGGNPEFSSDNRVPAVSGTGHPIHDRNEQGKFDPFVAGFREAKEEVMGDYALELSDIVYFGAARTGAYMFPFLFGELRVPLTKKQYEDQTVLHRNDVYAKHGRPFTIESVTDWILELYHRYDEDGRLLSRPSHTGIFSLYQSLIYQFPERKNEINALLQRD
ncbi:serine/threonine protein kinase [Planctomycetes bacterium K23_9]|uniref:Serine/threonine-protein kinase PrkC n=1 Tax=Stieleria marina TaxID=1930275 RepID=A0A517NUE2_9BACT|nr:Serine/threonine-protein kinase PrkC [Planctomycetes bacterium K23_9]